jgi:hypothetical protein
LPSDDEEEEEEEEGVEEEDDEEEGRSKNSGSTRVKYALRSKKPVVVVSSTRKSQPLPSDSEEGILFWEVFVFLLLLIVDIKK